MWLPASLRSIPSSMSSGENVIHELNSAAALFTLRKDIRDRFLRFVICGEATMASLVIKVAFPADPELKGRDFPSGGVCIRSHTPQHRQPDRSHQRDMTLSCCPLLSRQSVRATEKRSTGELIVLRQLKVKLTDSRIAVSPRRRCVECDSWQNEGVTARFEICAPHSTSRPQRMYCFAIDALAAFTLCLG